MPTDMMPEPATPPIGGPLLGDVFGHLLLTCLEQGGQPGAVFEIVERDDGYINVGDMARYLALPDAWPPLDRWAVAQATLASSARICRYGSRRAMPCTRSNPVS